MPVPLYLDVHVDKSIHDQLRLRGVDVVRDDLEVVDGVFGDGHAVVSFGVVVCGDGNVNSSLDNPTQWTVGDGLCAASRPARETVMRPGTQQASADSSWLPRCVRSSIVAIPRGRLQLLRGHGGGRR